MVKDFIEAGGTIEVPGHVSRSEAGADSLKRRDQAGKSVVEGGAGAADARPEIVRAAGEAERIGEARPGERGGRIARAFEHRFGQGDRGDLRQVGKKGEQAVVSGGVKPYGARPNGPEHGDEAANTVVFGFRGGGFGLAGLADENVGGVAEEIGVGVFDTAALATGNGMTAEETARRQECAARLLADGGFGASSIGHQCLGRNCGGDFRQAMNRHVDGQRHVDQIGFATDGGKVFRSFVDGAALARTGEDICTVPGGDAHFRKRAAERQSEGAADESGAENSGVAKGRGHGSGQAAADGRGDLAQLAHEMLELLE